MSTTRILVRYLRPSLNWEGEFRRFGQMQEYDNDREAVQEPKRAVTIAEPRAERHRDRI
jgi:hypothetical protein